MAELFSFGSESVTEGHPDKLCDRVSDAVLDACLAQDPEARVACKACTKTGMVMILGEVITKASVNYEQVIREAVKATGYDSDDKGLDWRTVNVIVAIDEQSPDLAQAITINKVAEEVGAGDHGVVFGYATDETPERMPLSHLLASRLCSQLDKARKNGTIAWARPHGRAQVVLDYKEAADGSVSPAKVKSVVVCARHAADVKPDQVEKDLMEHVVRVVLPAGLCDSSTSYHLVQPKQLVFGGSASGDAGLSGEKIVADTYGGWGSHGGCSLSGKDGATICRAATYGARWAARSLVDAKMCRRCSVQLSYTPGSSPVSVRVDSYGTSKAFGKTDAELASMLLRNFDFRPGCLQRDLGLKAPQFQTFSSYGHLGRSDLEAQPAWEKSKELK